MGNLIYHSRNFGNSNITVYYIQTESQTKRVATVARAKKCQRRNIPIATQSACQRRRSAPK